MVPNSPETWRDFFTAQAATYLDNEFTKNTRVEVQFIQELFGLPPKSRILDIGCGVGRHAIQLARAGYSVTGVDLTPAMILEGSRMAKQAGVKVDFIVADATQYVAAEPFDAAICLCEGGIGLIGHDEDPIQHDLSILRNVAASLRPGAPFLLTALNGYAAIRKMTDEAVQSGAFEPATMTLRYADTWATAAGEVEMYIKERQFIPPEMIAMLHHSGFMVRNVWGGTAGDWGRRPLKLDEIEAMYDCVRSA